MSAQCSGVAFALDCRARAWSDSVGTTQPLGVDGPSKWPREWTLHCLYPLFGDIGTLFGALLEVPVDEIRLWGLRFRVASVLEGFGSFVLDARLRGIRPHVARLKQGQTSGKA